MASTNRSRRGHLSAKVPNVKLRPVPQQSTSTSKQGKSRAADDDEEEEDEQQPIGMRGRSGLRNIVRGRERSLSTENLMDKEIRRNMYAADGMEDEDNHFQENTSSSKPFQNLIVCFTGISEEKASLSTLLKNLGVKRIESNFTVFVNVLVSNGFGSPKYLCALENRIPVVTTDWIKETHSKWIEGGQVDVEQSLRDYRLLAFRGLKIAISGIEPVDRRLKMQQLISEHGGVYSKNLDHKCSHLVVASPQPTNPSSSKGNTSNINNNNNNSNNAGDSSSNYSAKVRWALSSHTTLLKPGHPLEYAKEYIHTVWEGWFWDCVEFGGRWVEGRWDLRAVKRPERVESMIEKEQAAIEAKQKAEDAAAAQNLINSVLQHDNDPARQEVVGEAMDIDTALVGGPEILEPAIIRKRPREEGSTAVVTGNKVRGVPGPGGVQGLVDDLLVSVHRDRNGSSSAMDVDTDEVDSKPKVLDTPDVEVPDQQTSRKRPRLALVGSQDKDKDKDKMSGGTTTKSSPRRASAKSNSKAGLSSVLHASREQAFTKEEETDEKPIIETKPLIPVTKTVTSSPQEGKGEDGLPLKYNSELFKGLSFGHTVVEKGKTLETALQLCGGRVVARDEVEKGEKVDYMVVRLSSADISGIPNDSGAQIVTECWVERCLAANRVISPDENIVCRPLTISTPVNGIEHIKIHVSGLSAAQTSYAKRLIKALGCSVSLVFSKLKTTHLVLDSPQTVNPTKFEKAKQWNMPTVTLEWLYAIARSGNVEPIEPYIVDALPAAEGVNRPTGSNPSKRIISSVATSNLSMMTESPNLFAFANSSGVGGLVRDESQSISARSRLGSQPKQKLGLTPTEVNPVESSDGAHHPFSPARKTTDRLVNGTTSSELAHDQPLAGPSKGALPTTSNPFRVVKEEARKRNETSSTSNILPADLFDRLEKADAGAEERKQRGVRRPRLNAVRKNSGATNRSIMSSSTTSAKQPDEDDGEMSVDMEGVEDYGQSEDQGDQSIRVRYTDPAADKEKKKLLDALTKPQGSLSRRR